MSELKDQPDRDGLESSALDSSTRQSSRSADDVLPNTVESPEERTARLNEGRGLDEDPRTPDWKERPDDYNRYGADLPDGYPEHDDIQLKEDDKAHILEGDENGKGGAHRHGEGVKGKSEFPEDWSDDDISDAALDVARNPDSVEDEGTEAPQPRYTVTGERNGVPMTVAVKENGDVRTAYPADEEWPRNT